MKVIFKPRIAPAFAPHFAPKLWFGPNKVTRAPIIGKEKIMDVLKPIKQGVKQGTYMLGAVGLGAGLMYVLDPDRGRRRRAMARDEAVKVLHETGDALDKGVRDLKNRVSGSVIEFASIFLPERVDDSVLEGRIRSALGRCVAHPHAVEAQVSGGHVKLTGHILEQDVPRLIAMLRRLKGVKSVTNELAAHSEPGAIPDLQGKPRMARDAELIEPTWTPAMRLIAATAGSFLILDGALRRGLAGLVYGTLGVGLVTRALQRPGDHSFSATDALERGVDLQKTTTIDAPLSSVFHMLANPENFPRFMSHVEEVKKLEDRVYRWKVVGPAGAAVHWDAEIVTLIDNELLVWKTRPGSMVEHAGIVRVDPTPYGSTRVHMRMSYRPPLGKFGMTLAELFSLYPKHMLDDDMVRFKSLLEQGKTSAHHEKVRLEAMQA